MFVHSGFDNENYGTKFWNPLGAYLYEEKFLEK